MKFTPHTDADRRLMSMAIGVGSVNDLFAGIPGDVRLKRDLNLPAPLAEAEVLRELAVRGSRNRGSQSVTCYAGAGAYDHYVPAIVDTIVSRPEFYTAYTPYQAEVSQGTLQGIYEFQSLVCRLTGMEVANASMYDCASALAETTHMARDVTRRNRVVVSQGVHPDHIEVIRTYAHGLDTPVSTVPLAGDRTDLHALATAIDEDTAAVIVQSPNFFGTVEPMADISRLAHDRSALLTVSVDPLSLGILAPPGSYSADVAVSEGQPLGIPLSYGGPYVGLLATRRQLIRRVPGRIVARTVDVDGRVGFVLALQTREQHIRRERATSNICTNQALCALAATVYLAVMGRTGLRAVALQCHARARYLAQLLAAIPGLTIENTGPFFKEFVVRTPVPAAEIIQAGLGEGILAGVDLGRYNPGWKHRLLVAVTEQRTRSNLDEYAGFASRRFRN